MPRSSVEPKPTWQSLPLEIPPWTQKKLEGVISDLAEPNWIAAIFQ